MAAPVWYRQTKNYPGGIKDRLLECRQAKETDDERHSALAAGVIERAVIKGAILATWYFHLLPA